MTWSCRASSSATTQSSTAPRSSARAKASVWGVARISSSSSWSAAPVMPAANRPLNAMPTGPVAIAIRPAAVSGPTYFTSPTMPARLSFQASLGRPLAEIDS